MWKATYLILGAVAVLLLSGCGLVGAAPQLPLGPQSLQASAQCSAEYPGRAVATFQWPAVLAASSQWLDLSLFDNAFAPGTFIGAGPLSGGENTFTWEGLLPESVHYWRVNSLVGGVWQPSQTGVFVTPRCIAGAAVLLEVRQECSTSMPGTARVEFRWQPSTLVSAQQQWLDLSLQDNGFLPGTFRGAGPFDVSTGAFSWDGIKPGLPHYWRVNTMLGPTVWVSSETGRFTTSCPAPPPGPPMPPPTPMVAPTPTVTPTPAPRTIVVFLGGLGSSLVGGAETPTDSFATIKAALRGLGYDPLDFVEYSYAGPVSVDYQAGSRFHFSGPDYACPATAQDVNVSVLNLRNSLDNIARAYDGDVGFALVGHSLGGLVAALGMSHPLVQTVVTLDSPLMGIGSGKASIVNALFCGGPAVAQLVAMQADPTWPGAMQERVRQFRARGSRIATLGNEDDCLYDPALCADVCLLLVPFPPLFFSCPLFLAFFVDETFTQLVPNANVEQLYRLGSDESLGHRDILSDPAVANFIASFIGPP